MARDRGRGIHGLCPDQRLRFTLALLTDATEAVGMCHRRCLVEVKHLAVAGKWVHDTVRANDFPPETVATAINQTEALTNRVGVACLAKLVTHLSLDCEPCSAVVGFLKLLGPYGTHRCRKQTVQRLWLARVCSRPRPRGRHKSLGRDALPKPSSIER